VSSLTRFFKLPRAYKKLRRFKDIAAILARHGFADVATRTGIGRVLSVTRKIVSLGHWKNREAVSTGSRLRAVCEELGPTFIKFGQLLANRPDLLPREVIEELSKLQDQVPPFSFDEVKAIVEQELGKSLSEVFKSVEQTPLAAASIAQVHRAVLATGEQVVLKVRRPGIERIIKEDLAVLRDIGAYIETNFEGLEHMRPRSIVEEFARTISRETDFRAEARSMVRFAANFQDEPNIRIPAVYKELSTGQLIVMEYVEGVKVTQVRNWDDFPLKPAEIAELGTRLLLRSVFEFRFYHADPHPGNFMIAPDGKVCLLDFGMMGFVDEVRMEQMLSFMVGLVSLDPKMLVEAILESGLAPANLDTRELRRDVEVMLNQFATLSLQEIEIDPLFRVAVDTIARHRISLPTDLLMAARAISTMEGIARRIYPQFQPLEAIQPYLISLFLKRALDPTNQSARIIDGVADWAGAVKQLPMEVSDVMRRLKAGDITVRMQSEDAERIARKQSRSFNRIAASFLAVSGVAASALLANLPSFPDWAPGASLAASFLLALWVLNGIRRSGGV